MTDAWNRLVQVNNIGTAVLATTPFSSVGQIVSGDLGDLVCRYTYDGLGRLIKKENPVVVERVPGGDPRGGGGGGASITILQAKDYYYDGVRRIQEVISRPLPEIIDDLSEQTGIRNDELPMLHGGELPPGGEAPDPNLPQAWAEQWVDREYVYGPGYVDEFVCQIDRDGNIIYMLQDANYNVVALVSGGWTGTGDPPVNYASPGTVLEQYTYEPYGSVLVGEAFATHAVNRVGFQGLFFERYDGSYADPTIAPGVTGLYHARNRFYNPILGRFIQRDVNETALPIITALAMNGEVVSILMSGFDAQGLYGDGMNLYEFAGGNPVNSRDPSGLELDEDIDDAIADLDGWRASTGEYIREASGWALFGLEMMADVYDAAFSTYIGVDFEGAARILNGNGTAQDLLDLAFGGGTAFIGVPGGGLSAASQGGRAGLAAKVLSKAAKWQQKYAKLAKYGQRIAGMLVLRVEKAIKAVRKGEDVMVGSQREAEEVLRSARPDLPLRPTYEKGSGTGVFGWEVHSSDGSGVNRPHIKWYDYRKGKRGSGGYSGHIYFDAID